MGYYMKYEGKFVGDRHKLHDTPIFARYMHHPSICRNVAKIMREKEFNGEFRVYHWSSKEDVTERVLNHGS